MESTRSLQQLLLRRLAAHGALMDADALLEGLPEVAADHLADLVAAGAVVQLSRTGQFHLAGGRMARHAAQKLLMHDTEMRVCVLGRVEAAQGGRRLYRLGIARRQHEPGTDCTAGLDSLVMAEVEVPLPEDPAAATQMVADIAHRVAQALESPVYAPAPAPALTA